MKRIIGFFALLTGITMVSGIEAMKYSNQMNAEDLMYAIDQAVHKGDLARTKLLLSDLTVPGPKQTMPVTHGGTTMNVGLETRLTLDQKLMYSLALLDAINANDPEIVRFIVDKYPNLVNSRETARGKLSMSLRDWARQLLQEGKGNERVVRILNAVA